MFKARKSYQQVAQFN